MGLVVGTNALQPDWANEYTVKFPASRFVRVFWTYGEGLPNWGVSRFTDLPQTIVPHISWKDWASDGAVTSWVTSFLNAMPAYLADTPLIPELGISLAMTHRHEPENNTDVDAPSASELARRYGVLYTAVKAHSRGHLVAVMGIQNQAWADIHNGGDPTTWWPGADRVDFVGLDMYSPHGSYQSLSTFFTQADTLTALSGLRLWVPELGAQLIPADTTGADRAAWITSVGKQLAKSNAAAAAWWDIIRPDGDYRLGDDPSIQAWAALFAHGGVDLARRVFGDTLPDYAIDSVTVSGTDNVLVAQPGAEVKFYSQQFGGSQITDLSSDSTGTTPVTSVIASDGSDSRKPGQIGTVYGPDTVPETYSMWASANDGPRQLMVSPDWVTLAATVSQLSADLQAHVANFNNPHQVGVNDLTDANIAATPVAGDVLTYGNDGKWANLAPSQVAGALLLNPPLSGGTWVGNQVTMPDGGAWAVQGGSGVAWTRYSVPYSSTDDNPDLWQIRAGLPGGGGSTTKTQWANGNGEGRDAPSWPSRVARRVFEMAEAAALGPSNSRFFECSTNPTSGIREALLGVYGTGSATKPGWVEATRVLSGVMGVQAGGGFNSLSALYVAGRRTSIGPPTSGTWSTGMEVTDSAGAKWLCTAGGTPGTWVSASGYGAWADIASLGTSVALGTPSAQSRLAPGGNVELQGQISITGSISANTTLLTMPAGQLPAGAVVFTIRFSGPSAATQLFNLNTSGQLSCAGSLASTNAFNLDGLAFQHA